MKRKLHKLKKSVLRELEIARRQYKEGKYYTLEEVKKKLDIK